LEVQWVALARNFARPSVGSNTAAKIPIMAITTNNSIRVKAGTWQTKSFTWQVQSRARCKKNFYLISARIITLVSESCRRIE